ncbi:MAG: hypothetical protein Q8N46_00555 [Anaerolineales bacterium]|nr:hypothetical protein [Anaerolineales bacterium]
MATEATLLAEKTNIEAALAGMTSSPKPSYRIGDRSFDWNEYYKVLMQRLEQLKEELSCLPVTEETIYRDPERE